MLCRRVILTRRILRGTICFFFKLKNKFSLPWKWVGYRFHSFFLGAGCSNLANATLSEKGSQPWPERQKLCAQLIMEVLNYTSFSAPAVGSMTTWAVNASFDVRSYAWLRNHASDRCSRPPLSACRALVWRLQNYSACSTAMNN